MLTNLDHIAAAFAGTALADLPIGYGPAGTVLIAGIDPDDLHESWRVADALVPVTGRVPIMITDDFTGAMRLLPEPAPGPSEERLRAFAEAAEAADPWLTFRDHGEDYDVAEGEVGNYVFGVAGVDPAPLVADVPLPAPLPVLERVLYDRLLTDPGRHDRVLAGARFATGTDYWFTPDSVLLMLVPTGDVRRSGYWVDFYGALTPDDQRDLAEVLARWRDRWDARLVAAWGTMLQFQVGRPPAPGDDAWTAAGQIKALAANLDLSRWELAVALPGGNAWFLHNRP